MKVGDRFDKYTIQRILGEGGMATVYLGRHEVLGSVHALKVLRIDAPAVRKRLVAEGKVQASLHHPNVVAVTDILDIDSGVALVMEFVDGVNLEKRLDEGGPMTPTEALHIFRGIALGVAAAHRQGLVHRDLKPANILLHETNAGIVPKVTDFGLVKVLATSGTQSGVLMGTPEYMSPEQVRDSAKVTPRSDLWSLGALLYEMLTREVAFNQPDVVEVYTAIVNGDYKRLDERMPSLPPRVHSAVDRLLRVDPDERFATAEDLIAHLYPDEPAVREPTRPAPWRREQMDPDATRPIPGRRERQLPSVVVTDPPPPPRRAEPTTPPPPKRPPPPRPSPLVAAGVLGASLLCAGGGVLSWALYEPGEPDAVVEPPPAPAPKPAPEPEPAPRAVPVTLLADGADRVLVDGLPADPADLNLAPDAYAVTVQRGSCDGAPLDCTTAGSCPSGCDSVTESFTVRADGPNELRIELPPAPEPAPAPVPDPAPPPRTAARVTNAQFARWLESHPEWSREAAIARGEADSGYLRSWTDGPPPGPLTQVSWLAARAYCADRGGLLGVDAEPTTWANGPVKMEWRVTPSGALTWRRFDGMTSTQAARTQAVSFTGVRCAR